MSEPIAVIGPNWSLLWATQGSLTEIVNRTGIGVGTPLYAQPNNNADEFRTVLQAIKEEGMRNHATRCAPWWGKVINVLENKS